MNAVLPLLTFIVGFLFTGCRNGTSADDVKLNLPGTYIRSSQHEYGKEFDTIAISVHNEAANEFKLNRRWRYERVLDGKAIEPEYKNTTTTAVYDAASKRLKEAESGDAYSFDPVKKTLFAGATQYEKLK